MTELLVGIVPLGGPRVQRTAKHHRLRLYSGLYKTGLPVAWPVLGLAPFWWTTSCASPLKLGPTTCLLSQRLASGNPGKETEGEGGWVLWPAAHLPPKRSPETLVFPPRCFTFSVGLPQGRQRRLS